jgi:hypothetical protein
MSIDKIDRKDPSFAKAEVLNKKAFAEYKNKYRNREIVLCAAGPSLNNYCPIKDVIHVAVNRAILFDKIHFDYFFACDKRGIDLIIEGKDLKEEIKNYDCIKFFGNQGGCEEVEIPESYTSTFNCNRVEFNVWTRRYEFTTNIEKFPLGNFTSIVFPTLQFILYTNPKKIYLVGCDGTGYGHFLEAIQEVYPQNTKDAVTIVPREWRKFKNFARSCYPNVKLISINPIKLKNLFDDVYQ